MSPVRHDDTPLRVLGMGAALPDAPLATATLLDRVEQRFGVAVRRHGLAVAARLGIAERHVCRPFEAPLEPPRRGQRNPELAARAVAEALAEAGLPVSALCYLIGHTATPATLLPGNVATVAALLGFEGPHAEFRQACTGFVNGLTFAQALLRGGSGPVAVVGSETGSVHFDPRRLLDDPGQVVNLVQMGDGAAAIVLARADRDDGAQVSRVFHGQLGRDRSPGLSVPQGGSDDPAMPHGFQRFHHDYGAVRDLGPELLRRGLAAAADAGIASPDWVLPHQANGRIDAVMEHLFGIERSRVVVQANRVGNTGSAAIWLALARHRTVMRDGETLLALGAEATAHMFGGFEYRHG